MRDMFKNAASMIMAGITGIAALYLMPFQAAMDALFEELPDEWLFNITPYVEMLEVANHWVPFVEFLNGSVALISATIVITTLKWILEFIPG